MSVKLKGVDNVIRNLNKTIRDVNGNCGRVVADIAVDILDKSVQKAPIEFGPLRASGYVDVNGARIAKGSDSGAVGGGYANTLDDTNIKARIGFAEKYAFIQHEALEFKHPKGGQAKYLESTLTVNESKYVDAIMREGGKALK